MPRRGILAAALPLSLAAAPGQAQEGMALGFPQFAGEVRMGLYGVSSLQASDRAQRGSTGFLFGEIAGGLHLSRSLSLQGLIHVESAGEAEPDGSATLFRHQGAYLESLFLDWRATGRLRLFGGKFSAPFGYGHHHFPGVLPMIRAHETYLIRESLGVGATWTFLSDPVWGEHDLTAAVFTRDTTFLSGTLITRRRCCEEGFERYRRTTLHQGGPGNTGHADNLAIALDGDGIAWLPNFTYHLALLSRAPGKDGTRREWGFAAGARYEARWTPHLRTLFFAEHVEFRNAGGAPLEAPAEDGPDADAVAVRETRRFTTLGARTSHGPWRATLAWQRDERDRSRNALATAQYLEASVGRELAWGFGLDIGYQYARYPREDATAGHAGGIVARLGFAADF